MGDIAYVLIKVGEFIFPVDFVVFETTPVSNPRGQILVILGRPFLATSNALINCHSGLIKLILENMTVDLNSFNLERQTRNSSDKSLKVNMIQDFPSEQLEEDQIDANLKCSNPSFEELCEEEIRITVQRFG